jgi:tRNA-Thr(GGU) m(6)t(6)A37 methyltransferase TsaA
MEITYRPIGTIHSPHTSARGMPIQPTGAAGIRGRVELLAEYAPGLKDLDGFSHVILVYHFHQAGPPLLTVVPFMDSEARGLFATRAPRRPNPIGLSVVRLLRIEGTTLHVENIDVLDGTPLLDLKPYVPKFDRPPDPRAGWLEATGDQVRSRRADDRFD